jgi:putative iron-dependent peroxidase
MSAVSTPQPGIFALGTAAHAYLELDVSQPGRSGLELVRAVSSLREPRTTMGGVNLVAGFGPELWRQAAPGDAPDELDGFDADLVGVDGYVMPATQHDAVLWLSGSAYDVVFDVARAAIAALRDIAVVAEETSSWPYRHDRDLTGFIDGTENPTLVEAPEVVLVPEGDPGAGGTILLLQKWAHDAAEWEALPVAEQEQVIGRTKLDSVELDDKPADSHVAARIADVRPHLPAQHALRHGHRSRDDVRGLRRHTTSLAAMLSMAGLENGARDALTYHRRHRRPHFVPSTDTLLRVAGVADGMSSRPAVPTTFVASTAGGGRSTRALEVTRRQRLTLLAAILGSGVATIDGSIVNVALPAIERDLGGGLTAQQWVSNAYLLALAALILLGGSLGDIYGERRIFAMVPPNPGLNTLTIKWTSLFGFLRAWRDLSPA